MPSLPVVEKIIVRKDCPTKTGKPWSSAKAAGEGSPASPTKAVDAAVNKAQVEPEGESSPSRSGGMGITPGQPVLTWLGGFTSGCSQSCRERLPPRPRHQV